MFKEDGTRPKPSKLLRKLVYERDRGISQLCGEHVDQWDFDIGHKIAYSKGGKLTLRNAVLLHPLCNRTMWTRRPKQERKALGLPETAEESKKKALNGLTTTQPKYLAKKHRIKVKGRVYEDWLSSSWLSPTKRQYVNALSKVLKEESIDKELNGMPKPTKKKKRRKSSS